MKLSKKMIAVFMALLMTLSSGAITAFAITGELKAGSNVATKTLTPTSIAATAKTTSNNTAEYLETIIVTKKVNKNGTQITPDMNSSYAYNTKHSGNAGVSVGSGSTDRYKSVTSTHGAKFTGYSEVAGNLSKTF